MGERRFLTWLAAKQVDPFHPDTRRRIALVTLLAWAGLGANGLSSACYGPEKAFLALGVHTQFAPALALATMVTVFVVTAAYGQVMRLFPSGGGGYRISTQLLGPYFGLVSGVALLIDYMLAVVVSIASGTDAIFSVLSIGSTQYKVYVEVALTGLLIVLNLRGVRESIRFLLPIMLGFVVIHGLLIVGGIAIQSEHIRPAISSAAQYSFDLSRSAGLPVMAAIFLRAYSLGGSTYTGVDAVANNVNLLTEPRIRNGKLTSLYVATSLALVSGGLIFLYSLWDVQPIEGQTLNAVVFRSILAQLGLGEHATHAVLLATLILEGCVLFVAANSIFIFVPSLLGHMATDSWLPHRFRDLSSQLVRHNGIRLLGLCAILVLWWTGGELSLLLTIYSINVFFSFTLSKLGLCRHWWRSRISVPSWKAKFALSTFGFLITAGMLVVTLAERFFQGGWITVGLALLTIGGCVAIKRHYSWVTEKRQEMNALFLPVVEACRPGCRITADPNQPTAIFLVTEHLGPAMHELMWVQRLFPGHFQNFVFVSVLQVDMQVLGADEARMAQNAQIEQTLHQLENFCQCNGLGTTNYRGYGTNPVIELEKLVRQATARFPECVCFASSLILPGNIRLSEALHNQTAITLQSRLHVRSIPLVILPISLS